MTARTPTAHRSARLACALALLMVAACGDSGSLPEHDAADAARFDLAPAGRLIVVEDPEAERVEGLIRFDAGSIHDPADKLGLAEVMADALGYGGPMEYSGSELTQRLAARDAWVQVTAGGEHVTFDFACPAEELPATLDAIADLVLTPHYPPEAVEVARERLLMRLAAEATDPAAIADQALLDAAYGAEAPFTRAPTFESVESIERDDVLAFHRAHLGADRLRAGLSGPVSAERVPPLFESVFADLATVGPAPPVVQPAFREPSSPAFLLIHVPGADRIELRMGLPGVSIHAPDYAALRLWSDVHGSAADSTLELARTSLADGSVLAMGAFFRPRWQAPGEFLAYATTTGEPHVALERLSLWIADADLEGERLGRLPDEVVATARARVIGADVAANTGRGRVARLLDLEANGLEKTFWRQNAVQLRDTGAAQVYAAGARYSASRNRRWVVAGDLSDDSGSEAPAVALVQSLIEAIDGEQAATDHVDKVVLDSRAFTPRGTPEALAVLDRVFEALGGREAWAELERVEWNGEIRTHAATAPIGVHLWRDLQRGELRLEQRVADTLTVRVITQTDAWSSGPGGTESISPEVQASVRFREARRLPRVLHDLATDRALSVRLSADREGVERLEVLRWGRLLCWLVVGEDGRPKVLGHPGTDREREGEAEFVRWHPPIAGVVLPEVVAEPTLGRSSLWTTVRVGEAFDVDVFARPADAPR